ncbi:MAG: hypothetical protein ACFCBW_07340 [Candidatus Competibacterales bacterium]
MTLPKGLRPDSQHIRRNMEDHQLLLVDTHWLERYRELQERLKYALELAQALLAAARKADAPQGDAEHLAHYRTLCQEGIALGIEVYGDGWVNIELAVGPPLTAHELKGYAGPAPVAARLRLPSGGLHIGDSGFLLRSPLTMTPGDFEVNVYYPDDQHLLIVFTPSTNFAALGPREAWLAIPR